MCGIAGLVSFDSRHPVTHDALRRMAGAIAHRGPDGERVWVNQIDAPSDQHPQAGFAFRRLAVLDTDARAMQPMHTPDGRYTLVFNGEIYNYRQLRARLSHVNWRTTGDTEVLLHALATWGPAALEQLCGMFALAMWDSHENTLLLARDRFGQKPLYVSQFPWHGRIAGESFSPHITGEAPVPRSFSSIAFASELSALKTWEEFDHTIADDRLEAYLRYGYTAGSVYKKVDQIPPGHYWVNGSLKPYWRPPPSTNRNEISDADAVLQTRTLVESAVASQLVSDVPLGVFLSGGIDSSVVALCARKAGPTKTFAVGFDDTRYDESAFAQQVADHLGTEHHTFRINPAKNAAEILLKIAGVFGEPFADSSAIPTFHLAEQTRMHVTVALSGDGGDELFGGYDRYRAMHAGRWLNSLAPLRGVGRLLERGHAKSRVTKVGRFLAASGLPDAERYRRYVSLFDDVMLNQLLGRAPAPPDDSEWAALNDSSAGPMRAAMTWDKIHYLPGDLLTKVDRCSMAHALEVRSPFMDHTLAEFAARLSPHQLIGGGKKRMLREAFAKDLPPAVFARPKMGFAVPIGEWFRGPLRAMLHDHLTATNAFVRRFDMAVVNRLLEEHQSHRADHAQRLYALLMLEMWQRNENTY